MNRRSVVPCALALAALALPAAAEAAVPTPFFSNPGVVPVGPFELNASGSSDPDLGIVHLYEWDLDGDGVVFDEVTKAVHEPRTTVNLSTGTRVVHLRVTDSQGEVSGVYTQTLEARNKPFGSFVVHNARPYQPGTPIYFEPSWGDADLALPGGDTITAGFDFNGDGDATDAGEPITGNALGVRTFPSAGTYTVTLVLTDSFGLITRYSRPVLVGNPDLAAEISKGTNAFNPSVNPSIDGRAAAPAAPASPDAATRTARAADPAVAATQVTSSGATVSVQTVAGARTTLVAYLGGKAVGRGTAIADGRGVAKVKIRLTRAGRKAVRGGRKLVLKGTAGGRTLRTSVRVAR